MEGVEENPDMETVVRMRHEILFLRQEMEFLKKILDQKYREVRAALMGKATPIYEIIHSTAAQPGFGMDNPKPPVIENFQLLLHAQLLTMGL